MMNFFRKRLNKKGFTLVELLIVIAVLGIIAGIGVSSMGGVTDTFKKKADEKTAEQIARSVEVMCLAGEIKVGTGGTSLDNVNTKISKEIAASAVQSGDKTAYKVTALTAYTNATTNNITITFGGDTGGSYSGVIRTEKVQ